MFSEFKQLNRWTWMALTLPMEQFSNLLQTKIQFIRR
jgi:hypothetical protein